MSNVYSRALTAIGIVSLLAACQSAVELRGREFTEHEVAVAANQTPLLLGVDDLVVVVDQWVINDFGERSWALLKLEQKYVATADFWSAILYASRSFPPGVQQTSQTSDLNDIKEWRDHIASQHELDLTAEGLEVVEADPDLYRNEFHFLNTALRIGRGEPTQWFFEAFSSAATSGIVTCVMSEGDPGRELCMNTFRYKGLVLATRFEKKHLGKWRDFRSKVTRVVDRHVSVYDADQHVGIDPARYHIQMDGMKIRPTIGSALSLRQSFPCSRSCILKVHFSVLGKASDQKGALKLVEITKEMPVTWVDKVDISVGPLGDPEFDERARGEIDEATTCKTDEYKDKEGNPVFNTNCHFSFKYRSKWVVRITYSPLTTSPLPIDAALIQTYLDSIVVMD